jgi:hypothetical protein
LRKIIWLLLLAAALLAPLPAHAADKSTVPTLPSPTLPTYLGAYYYEAGSWYAAGNVANATLTGLHLRAISDENIAVVGELCGTWQTIVGYSAYDCRTVQIPVAWSLDCVSGTLVLTYGGSQFLESATVVPPFQAPGQPVGYTWTINRVLVGEAVPPSSLYPSGVKPYTVTYTADTAKESKAVCGAKEELTDPKKPLTTAEQVAILNELIALLA